MHIPGSSLSILHCQFSIMRRGPMNNSGTESGAKETHHNPKCLFLRLECDPWQKQHFAMLIKNRWKIGDWE